jgi:hypothetical protein
MAKLKPNQFISDEVQNIYINGTFYNNYQIIKDISSTNSVAVILNINNDDNDALSCFNDNN